MASDTPDRLPPRSQEAERSVLGSMLRDNNVIGNVVQIVRADSFYEDAHQKLFQAIVGMYDKGDPVELVSLGEALIQLKQVEDVGGFAYLAQLWDATPTAANAEYYAKIVRDRAMVRSLIHASTEILRDAYDQAQPAEEMLGAAERKIFEIAEKGTTGQTYTLEEAINEAYARIDTRQLGDAMSISGISTGYTDLDEITAGLQNSELILLAARPSIGKTAMALNLVAISPWMNTILFSSSASNNRASRLPSACSAARRASIVTNCARAISAATTWINSLKRAACCARRRSLSTTRPARACCASPPTRAA